MNTMADNNVQHTKTNLIKNVAITMWNITDINKKASELLSNLKNKKIICVSNFCNKNKSSRVYMCFQIGKDMGTASGVGTTLRKALK